MSYRPLITSLRAIEIQKISDLHPCVGSTTTHTIWRIDGETWTYTRGGSVLVLEATVSTPRELFGLDVHTKAGAKRRLYEELKTW